MASNDWFADAVTWASANGIVNGYSAAQFAPGDPVTREQLALILYNYAKSAGIDVSAGSASLDAYGDAGRVSDWAKEAMTWAVGAGILTGKPGNLLDPAGNATRAEVATMLERFAKVIQE